MKGSLAYVVVFIGSLITAVLAIALLMFLKPELFAPAAETAAASVPRIDSVKAPPPKPRQQEPPHRVTGPTLAELTRKDSVRSYAEPSGPLPDTVQRTSSTPGQEPQRNQTGTSVAGVRDSSAAPSTDTTNTKDQKAFAKVLEAMQAENAARILKDLPDNEVKRILLNIKKRQAAKILAGLEPDRAARIMR